ncbi:GGDEF domain-containing protein [Butyrivibrio sp. JL13D10]|uniref:GGDEF domain-containing protein n=1 Tax=Butyrivibrio sp. JL13D10 TaxID=3236815 RepID=UPI0038B5DFF4
MATFSKYWNKIKDYLNPYIHQSIREGLYRKNIQSTHDIALAFSVVEIVVLIYYYLFKKEVLSSSFVVPSAIYALAVSILALIASHYALNDSKHPFSAYRNVYVAYFITFIIYGMISSFYEYSHGLQMFIFFAIIFCLVNFILLPPATSSVLIWGSYLIFYMVLHSYDGAKKINLFNYIIFALLTLIGSFNKYRMQATELERIHRIETMNDMLQNVPVHDNITNMKNRYALRDDFTSYQNHHIIVVMLDLDEFKKVNEDYGQSAGDAILAQVGSCIKTYLTESHSYRYGSDSFLIILQDIELSDALQRLSIWERNMATLSIPELNKPIHYTSGYSHGTPRDEDELRMLIEAADRKRRDFS